MSLVAKRKPKSEPSEPTPDESAGAVTHLLRFPARYGWVLEALDEYAQANERSRNLAAVLLLRDAMIKAGYAPPPGQG